MIVVDAHEDLAWNVLTFARDYRRPVAETRAREAGTEIPARNGTTLLGRPEWVAGRVGLVFATLFAAPERRRRGAWDRLCYADAGAAHALYREQVDLYHRLADEHPDAFQLVGSLSDLEALLEAWESFPPGAAPQTPAGETSKAPPVGLVLLMEGADGVRQPGELQDWHAAGVRILGPAWAGTRYAGGTGEPGGFTPEGDALLEAMADLGMVLDLSHLAEQAAREALDRFPGILVASHSNARALLSGSPYPDRHLSDAVIHGIAAREGVIGIVPYNRFLKGGWVPVDGRAAATLDDVIAQIDHVCQLAGSAAHVGLGSDFDGGFGLEMVPVGLDSVADLRLIGEGLRERGYERRDVEAILGGNWLSILRRAWPKDG